MRTAAKGAAQSRSRRVGLEILIDAALLASGLLLAYFLLPLTNPFSVRTLLVLVVGLACVGLLIGWQARLIAHSPFPYLQALKTFAMTVPLFLVLFAATYYSLERSTPDSFNQPLSRSDALYFTMTVFSTVGFGDIVARSAPARIVVTVQMAADLALLGVATKLVINSVQLGLRQREMDRG